VQGIELSEATAARCEALGLEFLARFFEVELGRRPGNLEALAELGHLYTRLGRYLEGLAVDRRLVVALPEDPTAHYNLACSLALTGDADGAFAALDQAIDLGYEDGALLADDPDLAPLRNDPRFAELEQRIATSGESSG
jgi:tetratricopeptide (TPR) repeat protein